MRYIFTYYIFFAKDSEILHIILLTALHCVVDENFIVLSEAQVFVIAGGEFKDGQTEIIQKNVSKIFAANDGYVCIRISSF